ncbi:MAG: biopolymer transporter ExbD [Candidatus Muproteobacteria bacterium RIFCSPHIGHO2_01_FULL_65_16]|uniref:Biopolymer transporter ExbD n=1 Tax=Candidatus Muproteobacteria bacterium RIFCSPHIGHO2_01_FULL_65_16 TaxID=1817764 RepID=A0A1F6TNW0_9PROT|nr:MAG: biopolymer transporter ExbD [Candidatus Muproteobacteria bacterium RIFCSPHIGHO2_01_FULL_65_16]
MAFQTRSDHAAMSEINVTPLVDVMLVLLVIFIVTAPLLIQAVPVELPKTAPTKPAAEPRSVSLTINRQGEIFLDRDRVALEALEHELGARRARNADVNLLVQADEGVNFGRVAQVLALVQRAGITRLSVVTAPTRQ